MNKEHELLKGLHDEYSMRVKNINALRMQLTIETEPLSKNKYEYQLNEQEFALQRVQERIQNLTSIHPYTGRSLLGDKLAELGIGRLLGNLDLVNCNREEPEKEFWCYFDNSKPQRFKFYFLTSCHTQKPGSFAERMLYEFIVEEMDEESSAIYYRCNPKYSERRRPEIEDLPTGRNLENCQHAFRKYFAEFWKLPDTQSMDEYLKTGLPRIGYDAVAMLFRLEESAWKEGITGPYIEWIIDTLQTTHSDVPQVLVFLEIVVVKAHEKVESLEQSMLFQDLRAILKQHPGVAHLLPFKPVLKDDVMRWFRHIRAENDALLDGLLKTFAQGLDPHDRKLYEESEQFNMDDIELLQKEVFKVVNKTQI